uniref:Uncharacterized protein n=1 Tax=Arundo donax TaxID=35708 RepID=A0A0A9GZM6_ARUDO
MLHGRHTMAATMSSDRQYVFWREKNSTSRSTRKVVSCPSSLLVRLPEVEVEGGQRWQ